ncbi:Helix-turn-helix domain protein [Pseudobythopirellula maris]|uniref:Helix-turn-helix domain protein n=1 Tax=Pseudobythopirellula maris TaxID=2527991 RepID=A0A5C5ZGY3_9BACT|nr:helix-turn-helix domain-containing protein [Pseudobythopirellula maris]TWT86679.1 Helix-turn-helix domain protein [Pseudobythopirellula maris]
MTLTLDPTDLDALADRVAKKLSASLRPSLPKASAVAAPAKLAFSIREAAHLLSLGERTVADAVASGAIASTKIGRLRRINRAELERIAREGI